VPSIGLRFGLETLSDSTELLNLEISLTLTLSPTLTLSSTLILSSQGNFMPIIAAGADIRVRVRVRDNHIRDGVRVRDRDRDRVIPYPSHESNRPILSIAIIITWYANHCHRHNNNNVCLIN
jgi:hypothetical protein